MKVMKTMLAALVLCAGIMHAATTQTLWQVKQVTHWRGKRVHVVVATYGSREEAECHAWLISGQGGLAYIDAITFNTY